MSTHALYNTTYTLHRISPLHAFPPLTQDALKPHAKHLTSILRGDVLRGVRVAAADTDDAAALTRAGKLRSITFIPLTKWTHHNAEDDDEDTEEEEEEEKDSKGAVISIIYENTTYTAIFLLH